MANPQKENGYLPISNEIVDQFCKIRLSGDEWALLWVILRKTYGWNKPSDNISHSQFSKLADMNRRNVHRTLKKLSQKNLITIVKSDDGQFITYSINKDYETWQPSSKMTTVIRRDNTIVNPDAPLSSNLTHTKDTITKDINISLKNKDIQKLENPKKKIALVQAEQLYEAFKSNVRPGAKQDAVRNILALFSAGVLSTDLEKAVKHYAEHVRMKNVQPEYRIQANNFFGRAKRYTDWVELSVTEQQQHSEDRTERWLADLKNRARIADQQRFTQATRPNSA